MSTQRSENNIRLVALDLDGTLLTPDGELTARNAAAIRQACAAGVSVILATGKSRASAHWIIAELALHMPGVFTQGTTVYNDDGEIWHQSKMDEQTAAGVLRYAEERGFPYLAYAGEQLLVKEDSAFRWQMHEQYHEPLPEVAGSLLPQLDRLSLNKVVVMDPVDDGSTRRALWEAFDVEAEGSSGGAHVTQAVPHFVEVLPARASKGAGLQWLLAQLAIDPTQVMAVGDGENDIEMLQLVGRRVAMANAHPRLKAVANYVTADNGNSGVAQALERWSTAIFASCSGATPYSCM